MSASMGMTSAQKLPAEVLAALGASAGGCHAAQDVEILAVVRRVGALWFRLYSGRGVILRRRFEMTTPRAGVAIPSRGVVL